MGATGLCGSCTWAGGVPVAEALDAPDENFGCRFGVAQGALLGCLSEDGCRVVACGFGGGEGGCECGPGSLGEDLSGVGGQDLVQGAGVPVDRAFGRAAPGEYGEAGGGDLVVGGLEMDERLAGGGHLPVVVVQRAAALGCEDDEDGGVQEHGQAGVVRGLVTHGFQSAAQGAGMLMVGVGTSVGGVIEGDGGAVEFGLETDGGVGGQGVEDFAEDGQVGLGSAVGCVIEVVGDAFCCPA